MLRPRLAHAACAFLLFTSAAFGAGTFTVTNVNDAGAGSLRKALLDANAAGGGTVVFAIGSGPQTIQPQSPYPEMNYIVVDGTTQPGYAGKPLIEVDGSLAVTDIVGGLFNVNAGSIRGLVINNSTGGGVKISAGDVRACYIGTNIDGTAAKPNKAGVRINGPNVIVEDNLISGNPIGVIVNFWGPALIDGNRFGTDANETKALSTTAIHVYVTDNFDPIIVGGGWPNTFAGGSVGVYASYAKKVAVDQNYFGVTASGRRLPIQTAVHIYQSSDCSVTGSHIKGNSYGILIDGSSLRNKILGNSIDDNDVGIELSDYPYDGPTPNDDGDGDTGPNNYVNYPVLTRVTSLGGTTTVTGSLNSAANRTYRVELFASPSCAASGFGQGRQLVKALNVTTGPDGNATIAQTFAGTLNAGDVMTATATSDLEGTSEFSRCRIIEGNGVFSFEHATQSVSESSAIELTVRRNRGAAGPATVHFATSDGTAKAGSDYTSASGILSFADGETSKTIPITLNNDALWEGSQTFQITLSEATGAVLGTPQTVTVTIDDDENAPVAAVQTTSVFEGNSGTTPVPVQISISPASDAPVSVAYHTSDGSASEGSDYLGVNSTVVFAPGETTKQITVLVVGDTTREFDETFWVTAVSAGFPSSAPVTIRNDDAGPTIRIDNVSVIETDGETAATLTITASAPVTGAFFCSLTPVTATAGVDYVAIAPVVVFANELSRTITIPIRGDKDPEANETFLVKLIRLSGDFNVADDEGIVTILDDDVGVGPKQLTLAAGQTGQIALRLGAPAANDMAVYISASSPDAVAVPSVVLINAGASTTTFDVRALAGGHEINLTLTFPEVAAGLTSRVHVSTYNPAKLELSQEELHLTVRQTMVVHATLQPASNENTTVRLSASGPGVSIPNAFVIPAGGEGTFEVKAIATGWFTIDATLPASNGSKTTTIFGQVDAVAKPTIFSVSPPDGPSVGGTPVEVTGVLLRADCTIAFGGAPATAVHFVNDTLLTAVTPSHTAGTTDVTVSCGEDVTTLTSAFTFRPAPPQVAAIEPSSGYEAGGTQVRITGADFHSSCWPFFDAIPARDAIVRNRSEITAAVPAHAPGAAIVRVRCTTGEASLTSPFTFSDRRDPSPQITGVAPQFGTPGDVVTLTGTNFRADDVVAFDSSAATALDVSATTHVVRVPERSPGIVSVSLMDHDDHVTASGPMFTIGEASPPRVTALSPTTVAAGGEMELVGSGFRFGYTFAIGGRPAPLVLLSPTRAIVRVGGDVTPGSHVVQAINSAGHVASQGPAVSVIADGLIVSSVAGRCATSDGGLNVTISGAGFTRASAVTFNGVASPEIVFVDASTITARVPAGDVGPAKIVVSNPGGAWGTLTNAFRYESPFNPNGGCSGRTRGVRH